jgi:hypothetical protein
LFNLDSVGSQLQPELGYMHPPFLKYATKVKLSTGAGLLVLVRDGTRYSLKTSFLFVSYTGTLFCQMQKAQALEFRTPLFPHLVPPAIMVWIFVWKYIFEPFIHIFQRHPNRVKVEQFAPPILLVQSIFTHVNNRVGSQLQPELGYMHPPFLKYATKVKLSTGAGLL